MSSGVDPDRLETQIEAARRTISADGYPMSIGEITNMYQTGELEIRPEFQRYFRWSDTQKSRLVESILLGIPLPSIFVAQTKDGTWELVDGLQRVSTILETQGVLRDAEAPGGVRPMLVLEGTKILPALEGRVWESIDPSRALTQAHRLDFKRSKIDVKIIKRESTADAKYDLFQRLNSFGSPLTPQELRSALLAAAAPGFLAWMERLSQFAPFVSCIQVSEQRQQQRFDLELVTRFVILHNRPSDKITQNELKGFAQFLDEKIVELAARHPEGSPEIESTFVRTFKFIEMVSGEDLFRRFDPAKGRFVGSFLLSAFELFGLGVGYYMSSGHPFNEDLVGISKKYWSGVGPGFATGRSTEDRVSEFAPLGRALLAIP